MVTDTVKREWLLRWLPTDMPQRSALCRIQEEEDHLPDNSIFFHPVTARTAAALSLSAGSEKLLRENLKQLGYGEIVSVAYSQADPEKVGMVIASRSRDNSLQIAVVLRGSTGDEWFSNFDVGCSAEHRGFAKAADFAESRLGDYVFTHAIGTQPSFFVTGYSRGGAVANILSKRLCDRWGLERVCAYTFASPATTISRRVNRYSSIFNFIREEDFFTRVPPIGWGYTRYGRDLSLSDAGDITERFRELTGETYIGFTRRAAIDSFLCAMQSLAPNVYAYYKRRRPVGEKRLSLYEFMRAIAKMLSDHMDEDVADTFFSAMTSEYADLISFLSSGADLSGLIGSSSGAPRCSVADSHSSAAYMAALEAFLQQ